MRTLVSALAAGTMVLLGTITATAAHADPAATGHLVITAFHTGDQPNDFSPSTTSPPSH